MSDLITARIRKHADKLNLPHLSASLEQLAARADRDKMGYLDFLDLVLEEETGVRDGRRFRTALRLSKLPHHKPLDDFDFAFQPDLDIRKVKDLAALSFVEAKANAAFMGPPLGTVRMSQSPSCLTSRLGGHRFDRLQPEQTNVSATTSIRYSFVIVTLVGASTIRPSVRCCWNQ
ncbi:transposase/IS protein (plasmid) [Streptomyces sp. YIM 121038]|uniref:ATP-binding protein n=1 Tax=Streptomyces sp. YIM 121038 TaxID=2136401 RepID=UPI00110FFBAD|nr:ATP-binding protein [Streptomyces sp. YIM 121038]QCX82299.1 transposase/IS protein [Streptomyces sp. YIM 121038]